MYDAIIVGARCAGSPTAMLLARQGYRVLLVDKATFPSDTLSTHAVKVAGCAQLKRWGLLDRVAATNCPPIKKGTLDLGPFTLTGSAPAIEGASDAYCVRRTLLDKILVDAAVEAGAEMREAFAVQELLWDGDQVTGIRGATSNGTPVTEKARLVIGADGMRSFVARAVNAPEYSVRPALTCAYYTYWSGVAIDGVEFYPCDRRMIIAFPTNDDLVVGFIEWPHSEFHSVRSDIETHYLQALDLAPALAERVRSGKREDRFMGTADLPNFFRKPYGHGWALVGDAGVHKDPITAQGITDAFRDAELLSQALDAGFYGQQPLEEALADYERRRNEVAKPIYEFICLLATLNPLPVEMQQLLGALQGNQAEIDRFFGVMENTVPITEFFAPQSIGRIMSAAGAAGLAR
jgi:2-polyprenyl-6-methoxyphenol hydroxylase-like FAD-dependent oxidoreductase